MSDSLQHLLASNAQWAEDVLKTQPHFFEESAKGQSPHVCLFLSTPSILTQPLQTLWIGCADSRVPESVVTAARPGEIFVHRNIANQLHLDDHNILSVLRYAVDYLGVQHVIIVGHSECGGAAACLGAAQTPSLNLDEPEIATLSSLPVESALNRWLEPLTRLAASLHLSSVPHAEALPVVVEENVKAQVDNLARTQTIQDAWTKGTRKGQAVWIHGWVYDLQTGRLRDLNISRGPPGAENPK
ncbi:carbonic anhydrase [Pholiota molesta]|nr:carbonic anhydrase [Pholiota molesta]